MPSSMCLSICDLYSGLQICSALFAFNLRFCVSYYSSSYVAELSTSIAPPSTSHGMPIDVSSSLVLFPLCFLLYYVYEYFARALARPHLVILFFYKISKYQEHLCVINILICSSMDFFGGLYIHNVVTSSIRSIPLQI